MGLAHGVLDSVPFAMLNRHREHSEPRRDEGVHAPSGSSAGNGVEVQVLFRAVITDRISENVLTGTSIGTSTSQKGHFRALAERGSECRDTTNPFQIVLRTNGARCLPSPWGFTVPSWQRAQPGMLALEVYQHLLFSYRLRRTDIVRATNTYLQRGLHLGRNRVEAAKKFFRDMGIIGKPIRKRDAKGRI